MEHFLQSLQESLLILAAREKGERQLSLLTAILKRLSSPVSSRSFMNRFLADSAFREEFTSQLRDKTILFRLRGNTLSRTIPYQKNLKFRLKILPKNNIIKKSRCKRKVMCFYYDVKSDKKGVPL
nr:hypothetical protein [uncultured Acetatifactor sp.]